ncbi:MAG: hypothetical protein N2376_08250 [Clostridia bacterium]|nr:hypothetical protein [Clostridia bacterium]
MKPNKVKAAAPLPKHAALAYFMNKCIKALLNQQGFALSSGNLIFDNMKGVVFYAKGDS